jgi:hypothetical protein
MNPYLTIHESRVVDLLCAAWRYTRRGDCKAPPRVHLFCYLPDAARLIASAAELVNDTWHITHEPRGVDWNRNYARQVKERGFVLDHWSPPNAEAAFTRPFPVVVSCGDHPPVGIIVADPFSGPEDQRTFDAYAVRAGFKKARAK